MSPDLAPSSFTCEIEKAPDRTLGHCSGRLIGDTCQEFQAKIRGLIPEGKPIVVDLRNVKFIDSAGLGALVSLWASAKRRTEVDIRWADTHPGTPAAELKVANPSDPVKKAFRLTRLDKLFGGAEISE